MDPWTGPTPTPQQFPYQSSNGIQVLLDTITGIRTELREVRSNLFSTAGLRILPNKIASKDFDGTDRTHLGTAGWMLGSDGPGLPSYMGLNGHDIITELLAQQTALTAAQATLTTQQAYLASLITKDASATGFNTGTLINDATIRYVGATASLSIACPTGKLRIIGSCPEASLNPGTGTGSIEAFLSFSLAGPTPVALGTYNARLFSTGVWIGAGLTRIKTLTVTPGTYTVTLQAGYWCNGFAAASINFADLDLSAEVVNGS
jgi:hypothetical protein